MSKLKICFVVTGLNSGGIENYLLRFLEFESDKFQPVVICKSGKFGELESKYRTIKDIELIALKVGYLNIFSLLRLYKTFKVFQFHTVCDFTGNFSGIILLIAAIAKIKRRIAFYRGAGVRFKNSLPKLTYNKFLNFLVKRFATKILSNSKAALNLFHSEWRGNGRKFKVIYNGLNAKPFLEIRNKAEVRRALKLPENGFIIGNVGRYDHSKNHELIAKVASIICRKNNNVIFVLCGKNTESFKDIVLQKWPYLGDNFFSLGYRSDVPYVLKAFDLFLFPSRIEGQPNALIEAMVSDLPILASNIDPILETTPNEIHEHLLDIRDVKGFVATIEKCLKSPGFVEKFKYRDWAIQKFDNKILFGQFESELF
ncbi:hypothetical protein GCM10027051_32720 [Niabella terrae]